MAETHHNSSVHSINPDTPITEDEIYAQFDPVTRTSLRYWREAIVQFGDADNTLAVLDDLNQRLETGNALIFFDHHYAFDAFPVGLTLAQQLTRIRHAIIPYAIHLDLGLDPTGDRSFRYWVRTNIFQWFVGNVQKQNPNIHVLPVARDFERSNPKLSRVVESKYAGVNMRYLKTLTGMFQEQERGLVCVLSPIAGLALPEKPVLHAQLYRLLDSIQRKTGRSLPCYYVSAYPRLSAHMHYVAPLLTRHTFVAQGPFDLPARDYERANQIMVERQKALRAAADFNEPDYSRIEHK